MNHVQYDDKDKMIEAMAAEIESLKKQVNCVRAKDWDGLMREQESRWEKDEVEFRRVRDELRAPVARSAEHNAWLQERQIKELKTLNTKLTEELRLYHKLFKLAGETFAKYNSTSKKVKV